MFSADAQGKAPVICVESELFLITGTDDNENDRSLKKPKQKEIEQGIVHNSPILILIYYYIFVLPQHFILNEKTN
jgi:hypothetical protein